MTNGTGQPVADALPRLQFSKTPGNKTPEVEAPRRTDPNGNAEACFNSVGSGEYDLLVKEVVTQSGVERAVSDLAGVRLDWPFHTLPSVTLIKEGRGFRLCACDL